MTQFGQVGDPSLVTTKFVESANPDDLAARVNAIILGIDASSQVITTLDIAGGGDGGEFVVEIGFTAATNATGGLPGSAQGFGATQVRCYLASTDQELEKAKAAVVPPPPSNSVGFAAVDEQLAGASQGTAFMGMTVFVIDTFPTAAASALATAAVTANQTLSAGDNVLTFDGLQIGQLFTLPAPQTIKYDGTRPIIFMIDGTVVVEQTGAGDVTVKLVLDPLGAASVIASVTTHCLAGQFDAVTVPGIAALVPAVPAETLVGIIVTAAGGGSVKSGFIRIVPVA